MTDNELVKALRDMLPPKVDYAKLVCAEGFSHGQHYVWTEPEPYIIDEAATTIETLLAENAELKERNYELDDALRDMVCQFSTHDGKLKHSFMGAEENAYDVLNLEYGASVKTLWENRPQPPKGE